MTGRTRIAVFSFLAVASAIIGTSAFAQIPDGVSPGAVDRIAEIEGRCPTFIWGTLADAVNHELVVYRLPEGLDPSDLAAVDFSNADQVLYAKVPGSAPAWEPELAECLTPGGNYVWFVRAVYQEEEGEVAEASEWSFGKYFSISSMPSALEVEEAVRVLRRYAGSKGDPGEFETERADTGRPVLSRPVTLQQQPLKSVTSAKTAIKGSVSDATGETYGVVGISNSPDGAGVAAANSNGGPDLVLDGSEDYLVDAEFSESGINRPWGTPQTFNIRNSAGSGMTLQVDGVEVVTTATDQDAVGALSCASGEVAKYNGSAWNCAPDDDTTYSAGTGLNLSSDTFNVNTSVIQARVSSTCNAGSSIRSIASNGTVTCEPDTDTDTNTTYSAGTGMTLSDTTFSTQHYAFSAYSSGSATVVSGDVIIFGSENYDDGAVFNTTNNRFTAPVAGVYHFDAHIRFSGAPTAGLYMWYALHVNGNLTKDSTGTTSTNNWGLTLSADLKLTAGQYVDVRMGTTGGTPGYEGGSFNTWFNGHKVP